MSDTTPAGTLPEAPAAEPIPVFLEWFREAGERGLPFADAFSLATAAPDGRPSVRVVLYKGLSEDGAVRFVTNFESRKARELLANPHAAAVFFWPGLERQVRFEGTVAKAPEAESDRYFASRDRESQLGAWASDQSREIGARAELEQSLAQERERWQGRSIERPPHWGMFELAPERVELWLGGAHRLHDRFLYERSGAGWRVARLSP
ncbi:MAG TPA: pyridoxamine 5'-phosphate oxidase [Polyangiaceae bacterium]